MSASPTLDQLGQLDQLDLVIVRMLYQGLGDAAIGRRLGIGHRTVQRRVHRLMERWNVPGRVALGARAQELGLLGPAKSPQTTMARVS
ncbi:helix-turn-helix domain-containing protein [Streptomyces sp. NBC_00287]|uniref:helix-turn-helix domain-containing protein n=1 Tax=Streptomyces sp. NBC_00287 TaxID=2975702 RepID=UPI002E2C6BA2|nr:helix-turn-helix domain-containing protein [Streptomyces sp. NBC_00287]